MHNILPCPVWEKTVWILGCIVLGQVTQTHNSSGPEGSTPILHLQIWKIPGFHGSDNEEWAGRGRGGGWSRKEWNRLWKNSCGLERKILASIHRNNENKKCLHYWRIVPSREWWNSWRNWKNWLCNVLMSVRDGQRLGVLDSVSVTVKCLMSQVHGEVCRLGYRFACCHVERSVGYISQWWRQPFSHQRGRCCHGFQFIPFTLLICSSHHQRLYSWIEKIKQLAPQL